MCSDGNILQRTINLDWKLNFTARFLLIPEYELNIFQDSCWAPAQIHEPHLLTQEKSKEPREFRWYLLTFNKT